MELTAEIIALYNQGKGIADGDLNEPPTDSVMERIWEGIGIRQLTGTPEQISDLSGEYGRPEDSVPSKEELRKTAIPSRLVYLDLQRNCFRSHVQIHIDKSRELQARGENADAELRLAQRALDKARKLYAKSEELKRELASLSKEI